MNTLKASTDRKKAKLAVLAIFFCLLLSCDGGGTSKDDVQDCSKEKYVFPDVESDEWKNLGGHSEKVKACQIPQKVLGGMCTEALGGTCLDFPLLFPMVFAFGNVNAGLDQLVEEFNGFAEFAGREDAASAMLKIYCEYDSADDVTDKDFFSNDMLLMEIILAYEPIRNRLTKEESRQLIGMGLEKSFIENNSMSPKTRCYLLARVLEHVEYEPFVESDEYRDDSFGLKKFMEGNLYLYFNPGHATVVESYAKEYLTI